MTDQSQSARFLWLCNDSRKKSLIKLPHYEIRAFHILFFLFLARRKKSPWNGKKLNRFATIIVIPWIYSLYRVRGKNIAAPISSQVQPTCEIVTPAKKSNCIVRKVVARRSYRMSRNCRNFVDWGVANLRGQKCRGTFTRRAKSEKNPPRLSAFEHFFRPIEIQ